jgi:hypothetical protein
MTIVPNEYYSPAEGGAFLDVKESTIKTYCRNGKTRGVKVDAKQVGPRKEWKIKGASLIAIKRAWGMDT